MSPRTSAFPTTTGSVSLEDSTVSSIQIRWTERHMSGSSPWQKEWHPRAPKFSLRSAGVLRLLHSAPLGEVLQDASSNSTHSFVHAFEASFCTLLCTLVNFPRATAG
ncbi:uncharacterized protein LOC119594976 [Penaeus monodon]|uniref:uncharacterized protein LOC119594976 n=1 Tax=Penaeus monodon TaxID=6687 RepID=UPI0018A783C4|nr:uncharacterized protein LOC119594976 [Penaeus monodon]